MHDNKSSSWYVQICRDILALVVGIIIVALIEAGLILLYANDGPFFGYINENPLSGFLLVLLIFVAPCFLILLVCIPLGLLLLGFLGVAAISGRTVGTIIHTFIGAYVGTIIGEYIFYRFFFSEYIIQISNNPERSFWLLGIAMPLLISLGLVRGWFAMGFNNND